MSEAGRSICARAFAKINLTLRVFGRDEEGYHDLRTTFQSVGLYDTLTVTATRASWSLESDDPRCPSDRTNLVWKAAGRLWREAGRSGLPSGVHVRIRKRIPVQAGLGGGSSDAVAALRALAHLWGLRVSRERLHAICHRLGADVPFFLHGGTMLGTGRGDVLFRLADWPRSWVVLVVPDQGVPTADAYRWWDDDPARQKASRHGVDRTGVVPLSELTNDLQRPVAGHRPEIMRLARRLHRLGAYHSMMSGSGSTVFGLFEQERSARSAAAALVGSHATVVTRTVSRSQFERASEPTWCRPSRPEGTTLRR